jgi:hypothetical protein
MGETTMILERKVPGVMTINAPAIVVDPASDRFLLAWQQANSTAVMWRLANNAPDFKAGVQPEFDWGPIQPVPLAGSDLGPSLAGFKSRTFIAWKTPAPDNLIMVSYRDGPIWVLAVAVPGGISATAPCLAATADELYVFWRSLVGAPLVLWSKSSDGQVWSAPKQVPGSMAILQPTACAAREGIYVAWQDANQHVSWSRCTDGATFSPAVEVPQVNVTDPPALGWSAVEGVVMAYRANGASGEVYRTSLINPATNVWEPAQEVTTMVTMTSPGLASEALLMAWAGMQGSIFVGPMMELGKASPLTGATQLYRFTFKNFQIEQTRAKYTDTDYAALSVSVGGNAKASLFKSMGRLDNGTFPVDLSIELLVADTDAVAMTYSVMNAGNTGAGLVQEGLTKGMDALAEEVASQLENLVLDGILGSGILVSAFEMALPMVGSALDEMADWLANQVVGLIFPNCDGPVAGAVHGFGGLQLRIATTSDRLQGATDVNKGVTSADGCGPNSLYDVSWEIGVV